MEEKLYELYEQIKNVVDDYRAKDEEASCGEIAKIVCGELTKHGHHAVLVDNGSHVAVLDHTARVIWDMAKDLTDIPGDDEVIDIASFTAAYYIKNTPYAHLAR